MGYHDSEKYLRRHVEDLRRAAVVTSGVPHEIADRAAAATLAALRGASGPERSLKKRAGAYFWAVVRRSVLRSRGASEARARFLLRAIVADLEEIGRGPHEVWEEIQRGWADKVPGVVLEEYRQRLCA